MYAISKKDEDEVMLDLRLSNIPSRASKSNLGLPKLNSGNLGKGKFRTLGEFFIKKAINVVEVELLAIISPVNKSTYKHTMHTLFLIRTFF